LFWAGRALPSRYEEMQRGQAEALMPMLEALLAEAGLGWRDLGAIGVSAFELQAHGRGHGPLLITLPAPRGQAYAQRFDGGAPVAAPDLIEAEAPPAPYGPGTGSLIAEIAARRLAAATTPIPRPAPLYVRPADAAPMRDAAPVILP
ncbi:MAG: tRNA (adenosine(37)-N6)-threonylcarbamoyltransferase complex dimerization subunit type 1 TsaB, partial [Albidovulum sp.]